MTRLLQLLFALITGATDSKVAQMVEYLKEENRILRAKLPTRITLTDGEKNRLIKLGSALGTALKELITIVSYRTFTRWAAGTSEPKTDTKPVSKRKPGRPRTAEDIRKLVTQLATDNGWGYTRVLGELKKLGVKNVSRSTVVNILTESGLEPGPKRGKGTWSEFVTRHASTLWASGFVSVRTLTATGFVDGCKPCGPSAWTTSSWSANGTCSTSYRSSWPITTKNVHTKPSVTCRCPTTISTSRGSSHSRPVRSSAALGSAGC